MFFPHEEEEEQDAVGNKHTSGEDSDDEENESDQDDGNNSEGGGATPAKSAKPSSMKSSRKRSRGEDDADASTNKAPEFVKREDVGVDDSDEESAPKPKGIEPDAVITQETQDEMINNLDPNESRRVRLAINRRKQDDKAVRVANARLLKAKIELDKAQKKLDEAKKAAEQANSKANANVQQDADDLLLEPTPWNNYYKQLKQFYEREGHSNFKRTITDADVEGMSEEQEKELRTLSWWTCRQRKSKRRGELEQYKILLLNRLNFNWDPHAGPGPEKWLRNFNLLKDFKAKNGHVKVPVKFAENKLGSWLKTQVTQYRNAKEGRQPGLSQDRIRLLEEIGVTWGEKRVTTPWDSRFSDLLDYKNRFGHVNVPWQWKENIPMAQWVNSQRKKYKDLMDGKRNNLTEEQINKLNELGFKWNTGGRGRYLNAENPNGQQCSLEEYNQCSNTSTPQPAMAAFQAQAANSMSELRAQMSLQEQAYGNNAIGQDSYVEHGSENGEAGVSGSASQQNSHPHGNYFPGSGNRSQMNNLPMNFASQFQSLQNQQNNNVPSGMNYFTYAAYQQMNNHNNHGPSGFGQNHSHSGMGSMSGGNGINHFM